MQSKPKSQQADVARRSAKDGTKAHNVLLSGLPARFTGSALSEAAPPPAVPMHQELVGIPKERRRVAGKRTRTYVSERYTSAVASVYCYAFY